MLIENEFTVPGGAQAVWDYLLDVERIAPCMPGAEITEQVDDRMWKGKVNVRVGPVSMAFAGTVTMVEQDDDAKRVVLDAKGMEQRGKGSASATVTSWLEPNADATRVKMQADITLTGAAAQLSRGLLPEVSKRLTAEFANCLKRSMAAPAPATANTGESAGAIAERSDAGPAESSVALPGAASPPAAAKPVSAIRLGLAAAWAVVRRFFARLVGRRDA